MNTPPSKNKSSSISIHELNQLIAQSLLPPELKETITKHVTTQSHNRQITTDSVDKIMKQVKMHREGSSAATHIDRLHEKLNARIQNKDITGGMHHEMNRPFIPPGH